MFGKKKKSTTTNDSELNETLLYNNVQQSHIVAAAGSANIAAIYIMFTTASLRSILSETLRFLFFPAAAAASIAQTFLTWRQTYLEGMQKGSVAKAIVDTVATTIMVTSVIGGFIAGALFSAVTPFVFLGILSVKSLIGIGSEIYYLKKYLNADTPEKKEKYKAKMKATGTSLLGMIFGIVAVSGVLIAGNYALAIFGIVSGAIGGISALYGFYETYREHHAKNAAELADINKTFELKEMVTAEALTNNASMTKILSQLPSPDTVITPEIIDAAIAQTKENIPELTGNTIANTKSAETNQVFTPACSQ